MPGWLSAGEPFVGFALQYRLLHCFIYIYLNLCLFSLSWSSSSSSPPPFILSGFLFSSASNWGLGCSSKAARCWAGGGRILRTPGPHQLHFGSWLGAFWPQGREQSHALPCCEALYGQLVTWERHTLWGVLVVAHPQQVGKEQDI